MKQLASAGPQLNGKQARAKFIPAWPKDLGGFSGTHYATINAPAGNHKARLLVMAANEHEDDILRLLGLSQLPSDRPKTHIFLEHQIDRDDAWTTLAKLQKGVTCNELWLYTSPEKSMGCTLRHEICHVVLNAAIKSPIPVWIDEGFACCIGEQDSFRDEERIQQREQILLNEELPALKSLQRLDRMHRDHQSAYAVATATVTYLLNLGDGAQFLKFATLASEGDVENALREVYGIESLEKLDAMWQADPTIWRQLSARKQ